MKISKLFNALAILAFLLAACSGGPAKPAASTELNLYAWSEYIPQSLLDSFGKDMGIKVNYDTYSSNEELLAKLQAGASGYDVIIPSDYVVQIMTKQNMLEPLDMTQIPNFKNIDTQFTNRDYDPGNKFTVPYQWGTVGLAYDTTKITTPLTKWADMWDPAYKSNIVVLDDEREVIGMALTVLGYDKNSVDPTQLEEAKQKLLALKDNIKLYDSDSPKTALLSGEVLLGMVWNGEGAIAHNENPNITYICPQEGCGIWFDNLAVPKGAPHKDAAFKFLNYILDAKNSIEITKAFPYSNPNKAALDYWKTADPTAYEGYMSFTATNPSPQEIANAHPVKDIGDATQLWDTVWNEIKGGQ